MRFVLLAAIVLACASTGARAQSVACDAFAKNADGSWTALRNVRVPGPGTSYNITGGAVFRTNESFMGMNLAQDLDKECPVQSQAPAEAATRVELPKLADAKGDIDVQQLTCGQLASTYQEDADFLLAWYSGWYNGQAKGRVLNVPRVKENVHDVIAYCKANKDKRVTQAIDLVRKEAGR